MFSGNGSRNEANINILVTPGSLKTNSPDNMKQDGKWYGWEANGSVVLDGSSQITVQVEFVFDMSGPDDRKFVTKTFNV